jgi:predicted CXXCH cytochrome family protein
MKDYYIKACEHGLVVKIQKTLLALFSLPPTPYSLPPTPYSLLPLILILLSSPSYGGLEGSRHDMRIPGSPEPPCIYCHLPHKETEEPPLWDKAPKARSWPIKALKKEKAPASKICLSCHDGNIAQDVTAFIPSEELRKGYYLQKRGFHFIHGVEADFEEGRDHPIGIKQKRIAELDPDIRMEPMGPMKLKKGRIDCTTCHSVHAETPYKAFLVMDNSNSDLCLGCHTK